MEESVKTIIYKNNYYVVEKKQHNCYTVKTNHYGFRCYLYGKIAELALFVSEEGIVEISKNLAHNTALTDLFNLTTTIITELSCEITLFEIDNSNSFMFIPSETIEYAVYINVWCFLLFRKSWCELMFNADPSTEHHKQKYRNLISTKSLSFSEEDRNYISMFLPNRFTPDKVHATLYNKNIENVFDFVSFLVEQYPDTYMHLISGWYKTSKCREMCSFDWCEYVEKCVKIRYTETEHLSLFDEQNYLYFDNLYMDYPSAYSILEFGETYNSKLSRKRDYLS